MHKATDPDSEELLAVAKIVQWEQVFFYEGLKV